MRTERDLEAAILALEIVQARAGHRLHSKVALALVGLTAEFLAGVAEGRSPVETWRASCSRYAAAEAIGMGAVRELAALAESVRGLPSPSHWCLTWSLQRGVAEA